MRLITNQPKNFLLNLVFIMCLLSTNTLLGENTPAFPGAEGFGRYTTGGRGGTVYHVTSIADDNSEGTLRWALNKGEKRTIVFDVSGTIRLKSALSIRNGNVTIAGQTAPGDGICIADYPFTISASNVILRFVRIRLGNLFVDNHEGDGLGGMDQKNVIVDHCSVSWSIDECCSVYGMENLTVQWCLISQSLRNSGHSKGAHGYGGIFGGSGASYHHNLICHHDSRTPRLGPRPSTQTDERVDMRNNVIYNWGGNGCYGGEGMNVNIVNNYYKPGPGTKQKSTSLQYRIAGIGIRTTSYVNSNPAYAPMLHKWGKFFVEGNFMNGFPNVTSDNWTKGIYEQISNSANDNLFTSVTRDTMRLSKPIDYIYTTTHTPAKAYDKVLSFSGASLSRDWLDTLMVYDTKFGKASYTGTGSGNIYGIIDSQEDNKPANAGSEWSAWPTLKSTVSPADTDKDGMPDVWEISKGLNANDAADGNLKKEGYTNPEGYTNLEIYINSLVENIIVNQNEGGEASGYSNENETPVTKNITLSQSTFNGAAGATSPWTFEGGYSISNNNSKAYASGSEQGIKFSTGVKFTVNLPEGIQIDTVRFTGYNNYTGTDSYLSELNGVSQNQTSYVFTQKDAAGKYTVCNHAIPLSTPATGSFSFTFSGTQVVVSIILSTKTISGTKNTTINPDESRSPVNVYGLDGKVIRTQVKPNNATVGLPNGIYIVGKKKISVSN